MTTGHVLNKPLGFSEGSLASGTVSVGVGPLSFDDVVAVSRLDARVEITAAALEEIRKSRKIIEGLADDVEPHYGVSTGFG
ncbi:MAG: aromatic amino acid lyase, partial [Actinomycetota bacterium]